MAKNSNPLKKLIKKWFDYLPLSDEQYVKAMYFYKLKRLLNLNSPKTFNEKLHWLNLNGYFEKYSPLADKYAVREYVTTKIGSQYLNELYGVYKNEAEIDFDVPPQKFVLKATHGSGWNILCKDKSKLDLEAARRQCGKWLNMNYYRFYRETLYKNIPPRIICERYLEYEDKKNVMDYKFLCFQGRVQFINVVFNRFTNLTGSYYDRDWNICPFSDDPYAPIILDKPKNFERMKEIAEALAEGIPFVRVDLYKANSTILFGELTFIHFSGYAKWKPIEWDYKLGTYLNLTDNIK